MKAITFLPNKLLPPTVYVMPDARDHEARFMGVALCRFFPDCNLRVFVTDEARKVTLDAFTELVTDYVADLEPISIPDGKDEAELWEIFEAVVGVVDPDDAVVFDITHGYRSLPFLAFLAAAYLREIKRIKLEAVLYGNFEARDQTVVPNRTPVIDFTSFVSLLDWMVAANRFDRFGDSTDLADLLRQARPGSAGAAGGEEGRAAGKALNLAANSMADVSRALRLIRPAQAMDASDRMQSLLVDAAAAFGTHARPFVPLAKRVADAYAPIALSQDRGNTDTAASLARERTLVEWYIERKQYVQALAVAREWVVSWLLATLGAEDPLDSTRRRSVENKIGEILQARRLDNKQDETRPDDLSGVADLDRILEVYDQLGDLRNDLLHAGKRRSPRPANEKMERKIQKLCARLAEFPVTRGGVES